MLGKIPAASFGNDSGACRVYDMRPVHSLRNLVRANRLLASVILAVALLMKLALPMGVMPSLASDQIMVTLCSGSGPKTMVLTIPGLKHAQSQESDLLDQAEQPCAFAGLSAQALPAVDPILLAAAILFVLALGTRLVAPPTAEPPPYLRPPLRGPPAI